VTDASNATRAVAPRIEFDPRHAAGIIAPSCAVSERQASGAIELLLDGKAMPFIARYRKERTGGLDEVQLRAVEDALTAHRALVDRKNVVLATIAGQGKLDAPLERRIRELDDRRQLEDLYLPYRPKRKTRASVARERGLGRLAAIIGRQKPLEEPIDRLLERYVDAAKDVPDRTAALAGACDILAEQWAERADIRAWLRAEVGRGVIRSAKKRGAVDADGRFASYLDFREPIRRLAGHRFLAMRRGVDCGVLRIGIEVDRERAVGALQRRLLPQPRFELHGRLREAVEDCFGRLLFPSIEGEVLAEIGARADEEAIAVFASNLGDLLLQAPAGARVVAGIDPGFRTGCKVAVVDGTGRLLDKTTIYPTPPRSDTVGAGETLQRMVERHGVDLVAIGNGTASRETAAFAAGAMREVERAPDRVMVSEAGASVYSASELAGVELSDLDVSERGAVSIARRLQDPLAELVKIEPRSIGVGQYQHDVDQKELERALGRVVESCVNRVGVDLNTASPVLLCHVAGIGPRLAEAIVQHRDRHGRFAARADLSAVPRFGAKAFEQSAGFLRVRDGSQPLDASAVHPESYSVVEAMARSLGLTAAQLIGDAQAVARIDPDTFVDDETGRPTIDDILRELEKPGRDPRRAFEVASFREGVEELADLRPGMQLEGVVTNVTKFGAFVDVGVHQDGLVHVSELDNRWVGDPSEVVTVGQIVQVEVLDVDVARRRIGLSRKRAMSGPSGRKESR